jgi:hypothetical protein
MMVFCVWVKATQYFMSLFLYKFSATCYFTLQLVNCDIITQDDRKTRIFSNDL